MATASGPGAGKDKDKKDAADQSMIGTYKIVSFIAGGKSSQVWEVQAADGQKRIALKQLTFPPQAGLLGEIDLGHPPLPQPANQLELPQHLSTESPSAPERSAASSAGSCGGKSPGGSGRSVDFGGSDGVAMRDRNANRRTATGRTIHRQTTHDRRGLYFRQWLGGNRGE